MYEVEEIVGKKWIKNKLHYRVKWRGYTLQESTWQKQSNLKTVRDLISAFLAKQEQKATAQPNPFKKDITPLEDSVRDSALKDRDPLETSDMQTGNLTNGKDSQMEPNHYQSNDLRKLKFNFNQAQLVEALKNTNQSQKIAKGIAKNHNKKSKRQDLTKKQLRKLRNHSLEERKSPSAELKGDNESGQFEKAGKDYEQAGSNQTPNFRRCSNDLSNNEPQPQPAIDPKNTMQNQPSHKKKTNQRQRQFFHNPETCSQPQPSLHNQSAAQHLPQGRDQSKSAYTLSSTSNEKNGPIPEKEEHKRPNLKIRLLETDEPRSQIRDYLVQSEDGVLKVYSSVELLVAYPLEFIIYLQGRNYRKR